MNLLNETFSAADVAIAANIPPETLQNWIKRGLIVGQGEGEAKIAGGGSRGKRRQFSWESLMAIAAAAALVDVGLSPITAHKAANRFAMRSDGPGATWGDEPTKNAAPLRAPAFPFHHDLGETYLCAWGDKSTVILSADGTINPRTIVPAKDRAVGLTVVSMSELFMQIVAQLELGHPSELLDAAYASQE